MVWKDIKETAEGKLAEILASDDIDGGVPRGLSIGEPMRVQEYRGSHFIFVRQ